MIHKTRAKIEENKKKSGKLVEKTFEISSGESFSKEKKKIQPHVNGIKVFSIRTINKLPFCSSLIRDLIFSETN